MNILVGRIKDYKVLEKINFLSNFMESTNIINIDNLEDGLKKFKDNDIEFLIIDFTCEDCKVLLEEILKIDKYIKTISISNNIECSDNNGCSNCIKNFRRKRLLNTFEIKELFDLIKDFNIDRCKYFDSFENIIDILGDILKRIPAVTYDKEKKLIQIAGTDTTKINSLLKVVNILNSNNIRYETIEIDKILIK